MTGHQPVPCETGETGGTAGTGGAGGAPGDDGFEDGPGPERFDVPAVPSSVADARHRLAAIIAAWKVPLDEDGLYDVVLMTSELVANAVQHVGRGPIDVAVDWRRGVLRVEVTDSGPALPHVVETGSDGESGRGLRLVELLAGRLDWHSTGTGKVVSFDVTVPADPESDTGRG